MIIHFLEHTLLPLIEQFKSYAIFIAFVSAFGETLIGLGYFIPGSTFLLFLGVLAGQGYIDIKSILIFGIAGAYVGDISNYYLGRRYGVSLLKKPWLHMSDDLLNSGHRFLNTHGSKSIFFARFLPGLKESVSFIAGSLKMSKTKFLIWDFLGATGWGLEFIGVGFIFSTSLVLAQAWLTRTMIVIAILTMLFILLFLLKRFIMRNAQTVKEILSYLFEAFLNNPRVKSFILAHPKLIHFIKNRFSYDTFYRLPLTLLSFMFIYVLALFGGIIEDFLTKDPIVYVDKIIANLMLSWRTARLDEFFTWVTYLGKGEIITAFLIVVTIVLLSYKKLGELITLYLSFIGSAIFIFLGKLAFHRPRPEMALYYEPTFSFPSGHATLAVSFYGFIAYLLIQNIKDFKMKMNIFFTTTILVLLIGISRIYLDEHYLSDVYAGYLLGLLWAIVAITLLKWLSFKKIFLQRIPFRYANSISFVTIFIFLGFYLNFAMQDHYKLNPKSKQKIVKVLDIEDFIVSSSEYFSRNIVGIQSLPVNLVIATSSDICHALKQNGWHKLKEKMMLSNLTFWQSKEPECRLYKIDNNTTYLLAIWNAQLQYKTKHLLVATSDGVVEKRLFVFPKYITNIDKARTFAKKDLKQILSIQEERTIQVQKPFIAQHLFGQSYFSDGNTVFLEQRP